MVDLSFKEFSERFKKVKLPEVDLVVGIARGGIVPASLAAYVLGSELKIVCINYRDDNNSPQRSEPALLKEFEGIASKNILLVDDVSVSGKTVDFAKNLLEGNNVITMVMKGKGDIVLFPEIRECVNWPWKNLENQI